MLRIGLIGCGTHAQAAVIPALHDSADFLEPVAVADIQQGNLDAIASTDLKTFLDYREMIDQCDLDAVYIATLASVREQITLDAIAAGLHVMCEKPMAQDAAACQRIIDSADRSNRVIGVNFEMRFYDWVQRINQWITQGLLGRVEAVHVQEMWDGHKAFGPSSERRRRLIDIAGALDCGIHRADLARCFAGGGDWQRIEAVGAWFGETSVLPPHISIVGSLDTGACISLTSSFTYTAYIDPKAHNEIFTIVGTEGIVHAVEGTDRKTHVELVSKAKSETFTADLVAHARTIPTVLREFVARIEGTPHEGLLATGADGLAAQIFIERANQSAVAHRQENLVRT